MKYFCLEGPDGVGKTEIGKLLFQKLEIKSDNRVIFTKEPGSPLSKSCSEIRKIIINEPCYKMTEALLFSADAYQHYYEVIIPALNRGDIILSDRCLLSDFIYRPDKKFNFIRKNNFKNFIVLKPFIFNIQVHPEIIVSRMNKRGKLNNFEKRNNIIERMPFLLNSYDKLMKNGMFGDKINYINIDNNGKIEDSVNEIKNIIIDMISKDKNNKKELSKWN